MKFKTFFKLLELELEVSFENLTEMALTQTVYINCTDEEFTPFAAFNLLHKDGFGFVQVDEFEHEHIIQVSIENEV